jgi:hypothetical protein
MPSLIHSFFVSDTVELAFQVSEFNGKRYGDIRQFYHSVRYTGPTKHGLFLDRSQIDELQVLFLQNKDIILDAKVEERIGQLPYKKNSHVIVSLVESSLDNNAVCIDVREYIESEAYTGYTKKGFRLPLNLIDDMLEGIRLLIEHLEAKK